MYNQDRKNKFIEEHYRSELVKAQIRNLFEALEPTELAAGKDLCELSVNEVRSALSSSGGVRKHSVERFYLAIGEYCEWCIDQGVSGVNRELMSIRGANTDNVRDKMVASPADLHQCLNELFTPEREMRYDNVYRAYCWLAFLGFQEADALRLTTNDVSTVHGSIKYHDDMYPLYAASTQCLSNCAKLDEFIVKARGGDISRARVPGDQLLRGLRTEATAKGLKNELSRQISAARKSGKPVRRLSYFRIWLSGQYFRLYSQEKIGDVIDFGAIARATISERGTEYSFPMKALWFITKSYEEDYNTWKEAFDLK